MSTSPDANAASSAEGGRIHGAQPGAGSRHRQAFDQPRNQRHGAYFVDGDPKIALRCERIETPDFRDLGFEDAQHPGGRLLQFHCQRCRRHAVSHAHEQRVAEALAHPLQDIAQARLRDAQAPRRL